MSIEPPRTKKKPYIKRKPQSNQPRLKPDALEFVPPSVLPSSSTHHDHRPTQSSSNQQAHSDKKSALQSPAFRKHLEQKKAAQQATNQTSESEPSSRAESTSSSTVPAKKKRNDKHRALLKRSKGLTEMATHIVEKLMNQQYECMICVQIVGKRASIWSCNRCYALFHFQCIRQWHQKSASVDIVDLAQIEEQSHGGSVSQSHAGSVSQPQRGWTCPGCRAVSSETPRPTCFCRKEENPQFNPYFVPHSCGEVCNRPLKSCYSELSQGCPHKCTQLCHPGLCPPCVALGTMQSCYCGRDEYVLRCTDGIVPRSCASLCGKPLSCGKHQCQDVCHPLDCAPCQLTEPQNCYCQKEIDQPRTCGSGEPNSINDGKFSCHTPCNRRLSCGNHFCAEECHPGECKPCVLSPELIDCCPCGKMPLSPGTRSTCLDPIPLCPATCSKLLACGTHPCVAPCHHGDCPPCETVVVRSCRCRQSKRKEVCSAGSSEPFLCQERCMSKLSCGRHRCGQICCPNSPDIHQCFQLCGKSLKCRSRHKCELLCHPGLCPGCTRQSYNERSCTCGLTVELPPIPCHQAPAKCSHPCSRPHACDHPVRHQCYRGEPNCPPCVEMVSKWCMGMHVQRQGLCYQEFLSCGRICGIPLSCGRHNCERTCHAPPCEVPTAGNAGCTNKCGKELQNCNHTCSAVCHPGQPCPLVVCQAPVVLECPCGRIRVPSVCDKRSGPDVPPYSLPSSFPCDEKCQREERNRRLADAFGLTSVVAAMPTTPVRYAQKVVDLASTCPYFVKSIEEIFAHVIVHKLPSYRFPPLTVVHRRLVHEICGFYKLTAVSTGVEPMRITTVTTSSISQLPSITLYSSLFPMPSRRTFTLFVYELPSPKPVRIHSVLASFQDTYQLKYLDSVTALLTFQSEKMMRGALYTLEDRRFRVRECKDEALSIQGKTAPIDPVTAPAPAKYFAPAAPWAQPAISSSSATPRPPNQISSWEQAEVGQPPTTTQPSPSSSTQVEVLSSSIPQSPDLLSDWEECVEVESNDSDEIILNSTN